MGQALGTTSPSGPCTGVLRRFVHQPDKILKCLTGTGQGGFNVQYDIHLDGRQRASAVWAAKAGRTTHRTLLRSHQPPVPLLTCAPYAPRPSRAGSSEIDVKAVQEHAHAALSPLGPESAESVRFRESSVRNVCSPAVWVGGSN